MRIPQSTNPVIEGPFEELIRNLALQIDRCTDEWIEYATVMQSNDVGQVVSRKFSPQLASQATQEAT